MNEIWVPITVAIVAIMPSVMGRQVGRQVILRDLEIVEKLPADSEARARLLRDVEGRVDRIVERRFAGLNWFDWTYIILGGLAFVVAGVSVLMRVARGDTLTPLTSVETFSCALAIGAIGSVVLGSLVTRFIPRQREDEDDAEQPRTPAPADQS